MEQQSEEYRGLKWWRTELLVPDALDCTFHNITTISRVHSGWFQKVKIPCERQFCGGKCLVRVRRQRSELAAHSFEDCRNAEGIQISATGYEQAV